MKRPNHSEEAEKARKSDSEGRCGLGATQIQQKSSRIVSILRLHGKQLDLRDPNWGVRSEEILYAICAGEKKGRGEPIE